MAGFPARPFGSSTGLSGQADVGRDGLSRTDRKVPGISSSCPSGHRPAPAAPNPGSGTTEIRPGIHGAAFALPAAPVV